MLTGGVGDSGGSSLGDPKARWRDDGVLESETFGDIYFSAEGGAAESRHVFLDGCGLPAAWRGRERFIIGETGFGTGLNFLLTWARWRQDPDASGWLEYVAVEGFPLARGDLERALAAFPELTELSAELTRVWPPAYPGFHLLTFDSGCVRLVLMLGRAAVMLKHLSATVDVWYLDGFAPSKNADIWQPKVLAAVAARSRPGTRLASFTCAGVVRRGLADVGFIVSKRPGFGRKRQCISARFAGETRAASSRSSWLTRSAPLSPGARIAVIGGGIGGCAAAWALKRAGFKPVIIDSCGAVGQEASGNPCGFIKLRLGSHIASQGRFYALAHLHTLRLIDALGPGIVIGQGVFSIARDAKEAARMTALAVHVPPGSVVMFDSAKAYARLGINAPLGGAWFPQAVVIRPQSLCAALAEEIELIKDTVLSVERVGDHWRLRGAGEADADAVVIAAGPMTSHLWPTAELPIRANRGQISVISAVPDAGATALSFGRCLSPAFAINGERARVLGATYDQWPDMTDRSWALTSANDDVRNLRALAGVLPKEAAGAHIVGARANLRATISDRMPVAGPLFEAHAWRKVWADGEAPSYAPGLYVLGGLGSHGLQTAALLGETLSALVSGGVLPLENDLFTAVHPGRFLQRELQ